MIEVIYNVFEKLFSKFFDNTALGYIINFFKQIPQYFSKTINSIKFFTDIYDVFPYPLNFILFLSITITLMWFVYHILHKIAMIFFRAI